MAFSFNYTRISQLPKLAWMAVIEKDVPIVKVLHGSSVECRADWMVEGVWDGPFEEGNFPGSESFYGSGIRLESDKVNFVVSSSPIDRLMYCEYNGALVVSNSLVVLMAATGARLDLDHDYRPEIQVVGTSRNPYDRTFRVVHPQIECFFQVFHENIIYSGGELSFAYRYQKHGVTSYEQYVGMFRDMLERLKQNIESDQRTIPIQMFSTLSQGYDSTAVSSLVRQVGVKKAFSADRLGATLPITRTEQERIGAERIAHQLDLE